MKNNSNGKSLIIYLLISIAVISGLVYMLTSMSSNKSDKQYSEVMQSFDKLEVSEFELDLGSGKLIYKLRGSDEKYNYTVPNVSLFAQEVLGGEEAENYRKNYNDKYPDEPLKYNLIPISDNSFWLNLIPTLLMLGVMIFFFVFMMKSAGGGKMSSFGRPMQNRRQAVKRQRLRTLRELMRKRKSLKRSLIFSETVKNTVR